MGVALAGLRVLNRVRAVRLPPLPSATVVVQIIALVLQVGGAAAFVAGVALLSVPAALMVGGVLAVLVVERQR